LKKSASNLKPLGGASELSEYSVLVNKKSRKVKLPDLANKIGFKVEVNGKSTQVELSEGISYDKPFFIKVGGKPYKVEVDRREIGRSITVKVDGVTYSTLLEDKKTLISQALTTTLPAIEKMVVKAQVYDKGAIVASMPGKVVLLRAKVGDHVREGDVLLVLESMKMENEISSPISGIVKEVRVSEGLAVNIGEVMVIIG